MILCCGEALIDMLGTKTVSGLQGFEPHTGGAVFNTAIALARLDSDTGFLCGVSNDLFGSMLCEELDRNGVELKYLIRSERPTTLAFVQLVDGQANYVFYDENTAGRMLEASDLPERLDEVSALVFGGISLISNPAADTYRELCLMHSSEKTIYLDPNIRPGFIADQSSYRNRIDTMIGVADIVKFSDEDLEWYCESGNLEKSVSELLTKGPRLVLLTKGSEGAVGYTREYQVTCEAPETEVVDTVGAGDTFNAGVLSSLSESGKLVKQRLDEIDETELLSALEKGVKAAAVTVSRSGANPPFAHEL